MSDSLQGATTEPTPDRYPSDPGEFAATWNSWSVYRRERFLANMIQASERAAACLIQDHLGTLHAAQQATDALKARYRAEIRGLMDSLDEHITPDDMYQALDGLWKELQ